MTKIQKMAIPVFLDEKGDPIGFINRSNSGDRVIYICEKASEEQIIDLLSKKDIHDQV